MFHMNHFALGSIPEEGSSRKIISGLHIKAIATDSFRLFPPDNFQDWISQYYSRSKSWINLETTRDFYADGTLFKPA